MPLVTYSLLRLGLCAVLLGGLYLVGARGWLLLLLAIVAAAALSYIFLRRSGDAAAGYLAARSRRRQRGAELDAAVEDAALSANPAPRPIDS